MGLHERYSNRATQYPSGVRTSAPKSRPVQLESKGEFTTSTITQRCCRHGAHANSGEEAILPSGLHVHVEHDNIFCALNASHVRLL